MSNSPTGPKVIAIGVFDGVHAGHKYLIGEAKRIATELNGSLTVASFDPHPVSVLRPEDFLGLLSTPTFRTKLLIAAGADKVEYIDFTQSVSKMSPDEFVEHVVLAKLFANVVVVGENFRFGAGASGDVKTLLTLAGKYGFEVRVVNLVGDKKIWSSTRIRNHIIAGEVKAARGLLGRPHRLTGEVVYGDQRGRELGYPTANLQVTSGLIIPADGVYSGLLSVGQQVMPAAISIGTNPTFAGVIGRRVEAYVLDRTDLDLYGQVIDLDFLDFVRSMAKFDGIDQLIAQMANDVEVARGQITDFLDTPSH